MRLQQGHSTDAVHDTARPDDATEAKRVAMQPPGFCIAASLVVGLLLGYAPGPAGGKTTNDTTSC